MTTHESRYARTSTVRAPRPFIPRELEVYRMQRELGAIVWIFQRERDLTAPELLLIINALETQLIRHIVSGDPHPADL